MKVYCHMRAGVCVVPVAGSRWTWSVNDVAMVGVSVLSSIQCSDDRLGPDLQK